MHEVYSDCWECLLGTPTLYRKEDICSTREVAEIPIKHQKEREEGTRNKHICEQAMSSVSKLLGLHFPQTI